MPPAVHPYSIFNLIWECSSSRLGLGITDFGLTFRVHKSQILRLQISPRYGGPKVSRQFQFYSRQFQFVHGDFNLLTAISIYSRQFQFTHGNFNFLTANNAHGINRFAHHVKTQNQKSIFKVDLQREK